MQVAKDIWYHHILDIPNHFVITDSDVKKAGNHWVRGLEGRYFYLPYGDKTNHTIKRLLLLFRADELRKILCKLRLISKDYTLLFTQKEFWYPVTRVLLPIRTKITQIDFSTIPTFTKTQTPFKRLCKKGLQKQLQQYNSDIEMKRQQIEEAQSKLQFLQSCKQSMENEKIHIEYNLLTLQVDYFDDLDVNMYSNKKRKIK
jgi:hypothetical protein